MVFPRFASSFLLEGHTAALNCLRFSPDGVLLASGGDDCILRLWSVASGTLVQNLDLGGGPVIDLQWISIGIRPGPQGRLRYAFVACTRDGNIQLWTRSEDDSRFVHRQRFRVCDGNVTVLSINSMGTVCVLSTNNRFYVVQINLLAETDILSARFTQPPVPEPPFKGYLNSTYFIDGGRALLTAFLDTRELMIWNTYDWSLQSACELSHRIGPTAWCPTTSQIAIWNGYTGCSVYHVADDCWLNLHFPIPGMKGLERTLMFEVRWLFFGRLLLTGSPIGRLVLYDIEEQSIVQALDHSTDGPVQCIDCVSTSYFTYSIASATVDLLPRIILWKSVTAEDEESNASSSQSDHSETVDSVDEIDNTHQPQSLTDQKSFWSVERCLVLCLVVLLGSVTYTGKTRI